MTTYNTGKGNRLARRAAKSPRRFARVTFRTLVLSARQPVEKKMRGMLAGGR